MFDDAVLAVAGDDRPALVRAEQAACLSGIGRAIYDALLERIVVEHDGRKDPARHRLHLDGMVRDYGGRAVELDLAGLHTGIGIMPARLFSVLAAIGMAHLRTTVPNAHHVGRLCLD